MSVNTIGMNELLWQSVTAVHKSKHDVIFIQATKLYGNKSIEKIRYVWKVTTEGAAFISELYQYGSSG